MHVFGLQNQCEAVMSQVGSTPIHFRQPEYYKVPISLKS